MSAVGWAGALAIAAALALLSGVITIAVVVALCACASPALHVMPNDLQHCYAGAAC